jgi:hypothetical protein
MCMSRCSIPEEAVADEPGSDMTDGAERVSDAPAEPVGREEVAPCCCANASLKNELECVCFPKTSHVVLPIPLSPKIEL